LIASGRRWLQKGIVSSRICWDKKLKAEEALVSIGDNKAPTGGQRVSLWRRKSVHYQKKTNTKQLSKCSWKVFKNQRSVFIEKNVNHMRKSLKVVKEREADLIKNLGN